MLSNTEENYLKVIFNLSSQKRAKKLGTNEIAEVMEVAPATVTNMLKRLTEKGLVDYQKYGAISLSEDGRKLASNVIRKHRLWETFLYEKMEFTWDEVHEVAEQLEHIKSVKLINQLDKLLGYPKVDPHGDPIPGTDGEIASPSKKRLSEVETGKEYKIVAVKDSSAAFLKYATSLGIGLDLKVRVLDRRTFDDSTELEVGGNVHVVSKKFGDNVYVV